MALRTDPRNGGSPPLSRHQQWHLAALQSRDLLHEAANGQGEFLAWVRAELDRRGISQRALARQAGISHSVLSRLLSGESQDMTLQTAAALTRALGERMTVEATHEIRSRRVACSPATPERLPRLPSNGQHPTDGPD